MLQTQNYFEAISDQKLTHTFFYFFNRECPLGLAKFRRHYIVKQNTAQHGCIRNQRSSCNKRR